MSQCDAEFLREEILPELLVGREEQLEAIKSDSVLTVVSAGAGTGKTHTLAQRFAWLLAVDPDCDVRSMLVLTFTEKAAREMRERIGDTVKSWYSKYPHRLSHLKRAVDFMEDAPISTIHSFAMKVIRESALSLSIDPSAEIIPAPREELWWNDFASALERVSPDSLLSFLSEVWCERANELFAWEGFEELVNEYTPERLADLAKKASGVLGSAGKCPEELWNWQDNDLRNDILSMSFWFREVWDKWLNSVYPAIPNELRKKGGKSLSYLMELLKSYHGTEYSDDAGREFARELLERGIAKLPGVSKLKSAIEDELGCKIVDWRETAKREYLMSSEPSPHEILLHRALSRIAALGWECWDRLRENESVLSMNDLIRYAGDVLDKSPEYGKKFRHILIDEFQDTDPLQESMISSLRKSGESTLFVVGDLKQSIYRFRHADLEIFQRYIEIAKKGGDARYITLDKSYRTKELLLDKFNGLFSDLWRGGLEEGSNMLYEPISGPVDTDWWEDRNRPEIEPFEIKIAVQELSCAEKETNEKYTGDGEEKDGSKEIERIYDVRLRLFKNLAADFAAMRSDGKRVWDKTKDGFGFREVTWRDFAVLVPTRTAYPVIEDAFGAMGVPYTLSTSKNYFSRGEVADIVNLVCTLAEPENPFYLAGWLASPLGSIDPEEFNSCVRRAQERRKGHEDLPLADEVKETMPELWKRLTDMRRTAAIQGISSVIMELMNSPLILETYEPRQRRHVRANLVRMAEMAEEYEVSEGRSLFGFADYLRLMDLSERGQEEPDATDDSEDAVRVLTIHGSKGLEYPVTAVYLDEKNVRRVGGLSVSVRYGVCAASLPEFIKYLPEVRTAGAIDGRNFQIKETAKKDENLTVRGMWQKTREEKKEAAERQRLWYVAMTRARDRLVVCATAKAGESEEPDADSLGEITGRLAAVSGDKELTLIKCGDEIVAPQRLEKEDEKEEGGSLCLPVVAPAKLARISASAYAMIEWCPNAYRIAYRQGRNMQWVVKEGDEVSGADFGSLAHKILSNWDFTYEGIKYCLPEDDKLVEARIAEIPPYLRGEYRKSTVRRVLKDMLVPLAEREECIQYRTMLADDGILMRETPFRVADGDLMLLGTTDLMWEDGEGVHIRDWKTVRAETAPDDYYEFQLLFYAYAQWIQRKKLSVPDVPIEIGLNYVRSALEPWKKKVISADNLEKTGRRIHLAAETALYGEYAKVFDRCENCPWKFDCDK